MSPLIYLAGGAVTALAALLLARRAYTVITVSGSSMTPTYADGDRLLVRRLRVTRVLTPGTVVVFRDPTPEPALEWLVKRIAATAGDAVPESVRGAGGIDRHQETVPDGRIVVLGDTSASLDSRHFGFVAVADVLGTAVRKMGDGPHSDRLRGRG